MGAGRKVPAGQQLPLRWRSPWQRHLQGRRWQSPGVSIQDLPQQICPGWHRGLGEQGTPGVYGDVAKGVCFIDHAMSCNGVPTGTRAESFLGFSRQQCGRWFKDSLPDGLPEGAKDGAATQYLSTQCIVNYEEDFAIGDQFARNKEESYG